VTLQSRSLMMKATRDQSKRHNSQLILKLIYQNGAISRADIARRSGLTRTTVSTLVDELIGARMVHEAGFGPSIGGKPPTLLSFNEFAACIVCLDLSEQPFHGSALTLRGNKILKIVQQDAEQVNPLAQVLRLTQRLVDQAPYPILGIGIGSQGVVDVEQGVIRQANRLNWQNIPLREYLQDRLTIPVYVLNDSDAAAFGQYTFASNPDVHSLVMLHVGEGISAGILLNGKLFHGDGFGAGEIGHNRVAAHGRLCHCGHTGCLDTLASSTAILEMAREIYRAEPTSRIRHLAPDPDHLTLANVQAVLDCGDRYILAALQEAGAHLGRAVAQIIGLLNVQHIFFTGPVASFGEAWLQSIRQAVLESCLDTLARQTNLAVSSRPGELVLLGAAAYILREKLGIV
jgi:N-acetylglucosamine repressor